MIPVTKPFKTPLSELNLHLIDIWNSELYTNNGPKLLKLESELKNHLKVPNVIFLCNGTIALQIAIKALELKGEIITTPFSYVATTNSIIWEGCDPVFVDIEKETLNIDTNLIEKRITTKTSAILATHVFGNPCNISEIDRIAKKYKLKVIYDGAHAFGVKYKGKSIYNYGDIATCSTHATKLFHTVEGGFIVSMNNRLVKKINFLRNFGHNGPYDFALAGINGKNSEIHASIGLVNLKHIKSNILRRKKISNYYSKLLSPLVEDKFIRTINSENYSYYPILIFSKSKIIKIIEELQKKGVMTRQYFKPSLNTLNYLKNNDQCEVSNQICERILCLPIYDLLQETDVEIICETIINQYR